MSCLPYYITPAAFAPKRQKLICVIAKQNTAKSHRIIITKCEAESERVCVTLAYLAI